MYLSDFGSKIVYSYIFELRDILYFFFWRGFKVLKFYLSFFVGRSLTINAASLMIVGFLFLHESLVTVVSFFFPRYLLILYVLKLKFICYL